MTTIKNQSSLLSELSAIESGPDDGDIQVGSSVLHVTNLSKLYFRKAGKTKGDLLRYYARIAPLLLPHLEGRPLVLRRYPDGIGELGFFQQKAPEDTPDAVRTAGVPVAGKDDERRFVGGDLTTLLYSAQLGAIDVNPWHSRIGSLNEADYSVIDLDPGPKAPFSRVVEIALAVRDVLGAFALPAAVKTSGASGLHVMVPLPRGTSYESSLLLAQLVATEVAESTPQHASIARRRSDREPGQVYVDYLQNVQGKSLASVLSVRPQAAASVSMPVAWDDLTADLDPRDFTMDVRTVDAEVALREWSAAMSHPVDLSVFADLGARATGALAVHPADAGALRDSTNP